MSQTRFCPNQPTTVKVGRGTQTLASNSYVTCSSSSSPVPGNRSGLTVFILWMRPGLEPWLFHSEQQPQGLGLMERPSGCGPSLPARSPFWQSHWRFLKCLCPAPAPAFVGLLWSRKPTFPRWVSWVSLDVLRVRAPLPRASGKVFRPWKRSWTESVPTATRKLRKARASRGGRD